MKRNELSKRVNEYRSLFIKESDSLPARFGKSIYIQKKHHECISQIISIIGGREITLYDYLDNVLTQHLDSYREEISQCFNNRKMY